MRHRILLVVTPFLLVAACSSSTSPKVTTTTYVATMNAAKEVPAVIETGTGVATYVLDGTTITYTILVTGLTGPATASHIHIAPTTASGPVIFPFTITATANGSLATGTIDLTKAITATISGDSLKALFNNGAVYTNVHTAAHGGGEIRGQITKQ